MRDEAAPKTFGQFFKEQRQRLGLTLRAFCEGARLDAGNLSKLERGILPPPESREKLEEYASHLRLREASTEWYEFFDLAAAEQGRLPHDLVDDDKVREKLPVLFRTLRGQRLPDEGLDEIVRKVRGDLSGR